jgi:hypothetical protein
MAFIVLSCLAVLALVLGFFALLKQKTYIDANSGAVTSVELPLIGKLKTNYPALVFVFASLLFAYFASRARIEEAMETWTTTTVHN